MTQPADTSSGKRPHPADDMRIYGIYTARDDSRLWLTRIDGPERSSVRAVRRWKLAAGPALTVLWSPAAALSNLAS